MWVNPFAIVSIVLLLVLIGFAIYLVVVAVRSDDHDGSSSSSSDNGCHSFEPRFMYLYNVGAQTGITGFVAFDSQGQTSPGFVHTLGSSTVALLTGSGAGSYAVDWTVTPSTGITGSNRFGVFLNGSLSAGSAFGADALGTEIVGHTIVPLTEGTTLSIGNVSQSSVNLATGPNSIVNASLRLTKLDS